MNAAWQPGLFGGGAETRVGGAGAPVVRIAIDATSWVETLAGFLPWADEVFAALLADALGSSTSG